MAALLLDLVLAALAMLAIYGIGRALRRLVPLAFWGRASEVAFGCAFGLGVVATLLFVLGLIGWLRPVAGWTLLVFGVGLALAQYHLLLDDLRAGWGALRSLSRAPWFGKALALIVLAFVLANLAADLAPPIEGDTVHQYLLTPRYWVEAGRYWQPSNIWASTLPGNMMMLSAWALLLHPGGYSLATLITGLGMSALFGLGVYTLARLHFPAGAAGLAAGIALTMPDAAYLAQSAKVDMGWAFFEALALAAFFRWLDASDGTAVADDSAGSGGHWLALSGVMLGLAAGSKNQTWISVALLGLWIVVRHLHGQTLRELPRAALTFALAVIAAALPCYLYNAVVHLNPFYPVFAEPLHALWGATPSPRSELGTEVFYPWTVGGYLRNLWNASLGHTDPDFYLGFIAGPAFLLVIPAGWLMGLLRGETRDERHQARTLRRMLIYAFVFSIVWFLVKQAARHFLPGLMLLSVVAGAILWRMQARPDALRRAVLALTGLVLAWNFAIIAGVLYWSGAYRVALGLESRADFVRRYSDEVVVGAFPDWETIEALNTHLGPADRVLSEHAASPLYITPQVVSPNWGDRLAYGTIDDAGQLLDALAAHDIDYILVYNTDPDDTALFTRPEFLDRTAELVYQGPRTRLYRLKATESGS